MPNGFIKDELGNPIIEIVDAYARKRIGELEDNPSGGASVSDEHINELIDAKLTPLEELSWSILEVM